MNSFMINMDLPPAATPIRHSDKVLLTGSCFTEHISNRLEKAKMQVLSNPHGILFNPLSVAGSLNQYVTGKAFTENDLFLINEIWNHWEFHSRFSHPDRQMALDMINRSVHGAHLFLQSADWLIITLGSAYQYYYKNEGHNIPVANCHRAPARWFDKVLLPVDTITNGLQQAIMGIRAANPAIKVIFTISPVRHLRDGVINNNRSKARLTEAVHYLTASIPGCSYFPSYELVIDVLRDYRFYDVDMAHPNYPATQFVWEHFEQTYFDVPTQKLIQQLQDIHTAYHHNPRFPGTQAHKSFLTSYLEKITLLEKELPYIDFSREKAYFNSQ